MLASPEERLAEINTGLEAIRAEENSGFYGFYRWMWLGVAFFLVGILVGLTQRGLTTQLLFLCGGVGFVVCMARYLVLFRRWWPVGTERSRLLKERRRLIQALDHDVRL